MSVLKKETLTDQTASEPRRPLVAHNFFANKWIWVIGIILILLGLFFLKRDSDQKNLALKNSVIVSKQTLKETLSLSGKIDASEIATLRFLTAGKITWIGVKEGDSVKKYQAIASIDQRQMKETLQKYLSTYMKYRWSFDQIKDNYKDTAVSTAMQRLLDQSQFDLNNTVSDVKIQSLAIEYSTLTSPIDGVVTRVQSPVPGVNFYLPTEAEFDVVNPDTIYFDAKADQADVVSLQPGMPGTIVLDSYPDHEIPATVTSIAYSPKTDETGTVYKVKLGFDPAAVGTIAGTLRLGMTGDITFTTSQKSNVIVIPTKYLQTETDGTTKYVYLLDAGKNKIKRIVTSGLAVNSDTEILTGLNEGDRITQ